MKKQKTKNKKKLKSGILDRNGIEIIEGDTIRLPYVSPFGDNMIKDKIVETEYLIIFKHGCLGFETETNFVNLYNWCDTKKGEYIENKGNKIIIMNTSPVELINK